MTQFQNIEFDHPWILLALILIPLFYWLIITKSQKIQAFFPLNIIDGNVAKNTRKTYLKKSIPVFNLLALSSLIIALSGPKLIFKEETVNADGIDIVLAMDVSTSMLTLDFKPNRLEASKKMAKEFVNDRLYDKIGLVIFSGEAFTFSPISVDHALVLDYIDQIRAGILKDGTAIGNGMASAINRLKESKAKSKIIILLTDGSNNAGYIDPNIAIEMAREYGIKIYTIGVGTEGYAEAPVSQIFGKVIYEKVKVEFDEGLLKKIASETNGQYFRATDNIQLKKIYDKIDKLEKTKIEIKSYKRYYEEFRKFILIALVFLLLSFVLNNFIVRKLP
jgi:Ca-activated chloride channel family protein